MSGYKLASVDERHAQAPGSFEVSPFLERTRTRVGAHVKLIFEFTDGYEGGERMWVRVTKRTLRFSGKVSFEGVLENSPVVFGGQLAFGDKVAFGPEHIADVEEAEEA